MSRPTLVYEENWEEHLTSRGPGPSHWLFTGSTTSLQLPAEKPQQQPAGDALLEGYGSTNDGASRCVKQQSGDTAPDFATPASTAREPWMPAETGGAGPSLCREASISVDSLETVPSLCLRTSPSQDSLASWTSFDALHPDPFHVSPVEHRVRGATESLVAVPDEHTTLAWVQDLNGAKQQYRHHSALPRSTIHGARMPTPPSKFDRLVPGHVIPNMQHRAPRSLSLRSSPPSSTASYAALHFEPSRSSPTVALSAVAESVVQRPHVASQPAALATSPAAWSMRSILLSIGDASSSAAVRSLRRIMRQDSELDTPVTTASQAVTARRSFSAQSPPDDWVLV